MPDLNDKRPYHVAGLFSHDKPDDLGLPLPKPADGDTVTIRDMQGYHFLKFIRDRWYNMGFQPGPDPRG